MGRNINHSAEDNVVNLVPRHFECVQYQHIMVYFRAKRDIQIGEELFWNYNDSRYGTTLGKWSYELRKKELAELKRAGMEWDEEYDHFD